MDKKTKILFVIWMGLLALVVGTGVFFEFFAKEAKTPTQAVQQETPPPAVETLPPVEKPEEVNTPEEKDPAVPLPEDLQYLYDLTVGVKATWTHGSGLLVKRDETLYLWTAGYVVDTMRKEEVTTDTVTSTQTTVITWLPVTALVIKKDLRTEITADVIRYEGLDAPALLRLRETRPLSKSAVFAEQEVIPTVGLVVYHVADSPLFPYYTAKGSITTIGKVYDERTYDVTSQIGIPGSGGGGVFTEEGTCIGMVMRGTGDGNLILPSREIRRWAKEKDVLWALDQFVPLPSEEERKKIPVEG